jgi:hypothetical protein
MSSSIFSTWCLNLSSIKTARLFLSINLLMGIVLSIPPANAQYDAATVVGRVTDPSGAIVSNAEVALRNLNLDTVLTRKSNSSGEYEFPDVQIGTYTVSISAPGFSESITKPFDLIVSARQRIDVSLKLGNASETVTVSVDNAGLQAESGERSTTIESEQIIDLPLNGREYTDLALLTPGVQVSNLQDGTVTQRRGSFNVHGNRASFNNFILDGLDNNSYQVGNEGFNNQAITESVDGVQQFTVSTSNFSAEYGRAAGAIINVRTRSGTDKPRLTLFEYLRNTIFDAYGPFIGNGVKPALIQNQFGGSFGYRIPRIKDFFFFLDYEGYRQATHNLISETLPTMQQRAGIFMAPTSSTDPTLIGVPLQNPITGKQYSNGIIPLTDFTPFATAVLAALPPAADGGNGFEETEPGHSFRDVFDLRLDKYVGNRLQMFARFSKQSAHLTAAPGIPGPAGGGGFGHIRILGSSGVAGATYTLTANSLLDLRVGVTYINSGKLPYNQGVPNFYTPFNIPYPISTSLASAGLNTQAVEHFSTMGVETSNNGFTNPNTYNIKGSYTLAKGRHSFSFGYEWLLVNERTTQGDPALGEDEYAGSFGYPATIPAGVKRPGNSTASGQAYTLSDFIFGARSTYELSTYDTPVEYYSFDYGYAEDSWKIFPNLTLTYGLRYEFAAPERSRSKTYPIENFDPTTNALEFGTSGSLYEQALVHPKLDDFAPRFGFAYSLFPNIVFRGGYGISFVQWNRGAAELLGSGPLTINGVVNQNPTQMSLCPTGSESLTCFRPTMQGYPTSLVTPSQFSTLNATSAYSPRHAVPGYAQTYSFGTQVQIDKATILNVGYVGAHDVHLQVNADYNEAAVQVPGQTLTLQQRRPIQNFTDINAYLPLGFLRFNSLEVQLTHRTIGGLYILNSLTWSKAFDNASGPNEANHGDTQFVDKNDLKYDTGISSQNQTLNESLGLVWKVPYGAGFGNRTLRQTASGWTITTITRLTTGLPMNITYAPSTNDVLSDFGLAYRPNYTGSLSTIKNPRSKWIIGNNLTLPDGSTCTGYCNFLNGSQFQELSSASGSTSPNGNLPRNALTGPGYANIDLGLQKNFLLPKHFNLQFRVDAFNALNHINFKVPSLGITAGTFGDFGPGETFPSRQMQFAIRVSY